jgi:tetratricopeptide (TPR) repeat protein
METREQRMQELMGKVAQLQARKADRARRRQAYEQWRKEKANPSSVVVAPRIEEVKEDSSVLAATAAAAAAAPAASSSLSSRYESWDFWEPSSDEEESNAAAMEPSGPEFAAIKADVEAREARRAAQKVVSERANDEGNAAFKAGDFLKAVECYTRAIESSRSEKSYYTNRALAYMHSFDYASAAKDCATALDIYECFEVGPERSRAFMADFKNTRTVLKAYLRRAKALLALSDLEGVRQSLQGASKLVSEVYALNGRKEGVYIKAQKDDLAEIAKLAQALRDRETFMEEERRAKEAQQLAESKADAEAVSKGSKDATAAATVGEDKVLADLQTSLTAAHAQLLATSEASAPSGAAASSPSPAELWSLLVPGVSFLSALLSSSDGNKERVVGAQAAQAGDRTCVDVLLKLIKLRVPAPAGAGAASSSVAPAANIAPLPAASVLPQFAPALALLSSSKSAVATRNGIRWRERDGFVALGKYLSLLLARVQAHVAAAASMPMELIASATRALMVLTDRETARELLSAPAHAPALTSLFIELLSPSAPSSAKAASSSPTTTTPDSLRLSAANLMANLSFQPKFRTWLTSEERDKTVLAYVYRAALGPLERSPLATGAAKDQKQAQSSASVVYACVSVVLNLSTHLGCRAALVDASLNVDADSAQSSAPAPLSLLLKSLSHLTNAWDAANNFKALQPGSSLADLSDKVLSVLLNLCVDDFANALLFQRLLSKEHEPVLLALLRLAASPASTSSSEASLSESSTTSSLPPLLIERALGLLTRGLRREHNAAMAASSSGGVQGSAVASTPRPLRTLVAANQGAQIALRILACHKFASVEEAVTTESVLAKLAEPTPMEESESASAAAAASASASSSSAAAAPVFGYTRVTLEHASVLLATLLSQSPETAQVVASTKWQGLNGLQILVSALSCSCSRNVVGNACLCVDACISGLPSLLERSELSPALPLLLAVLKDPAQKAAHQNAAKAAIVLGRAPLNAEQWSKLRGLEIVASVMSPLLKQPK